MSYDWKRDRTAHNRHFSGGWGEFTPADARRELAHGFWVVPVFLAMFAALWIMTA